MNTAIHFSALAWCESAAALGHQAAAQWDWPPARSETGEGSQQPTLLIKDVK